MYGLLIWGSMLSEEQKSRLLKAQDSVVKYIKNEKKYCLSKS